MRASRLGLLCASALLALWPTSASADVTLAPGPDGGVGALLVAGPLRSARPSARASLSVDFALPASAASPSAGERLDGPKSPAWQPLGAASGLLDLRTMLRTQGSEATAVAFGVLRASRPFKGYLLLSVDDGVAVELDGRRVFTRDVARPLAENDDVVPIELTAGDHPLLLRLHQRQGAWRVGVKVVDETLAAARGVSVVLPGDVDADKLASTLTSLSLDRGITPLGLSPKLRATFTGGFPREAERAVSASAKLRGSDGRLFVVDAGLVPIEPEGPVSDLTISLPSLDAAELEKAEAGVPVVIEGVVGGKKSAFEAHPRKALREALGRAEKARAVVASRPAFIARPDDALATIELLSARITQYVGQGDRDFSAQLDDATALDSFVSAIEAGRDPFLAVRGPQRVAYRSPLDGKPSPFGLYVPPNAVLDGSKRYPLVIALHGMNGRPMQMMQWIFGKDDPGHDGEWEDRHAVKLPSFDAIVVTPMAHYNSFYRYAGEEDVALVMQWAKQMLPIDDERVSITGPSMGGTGTAWVAFRYAEFAAAAALCGYQSYFVRSDMRGKPLRPWEQLIAEQRSPTYWAPNGLHMPLWIVHGTRDLPEENSGVLIKRYKSLGYELIEEHPDEGHNVWQRTYEGLKGLSWLTAKRRPTHPERVVFRTNNLRYDRSAWVRVTGLERPLAWGDVAAKALRGNKIELTQTGITGLALDRDDQLVDPKSPLTVSIDGASLSFEPSEPITLERREGAWAKASAEQPGRLRKRGHLSGPIRDVHHEPLIVVYGTSDPKMTRANRQLARWFAQIRSGFEIDYPIVADVDLDPALAKTHSLVLVGGPSSNALTASIDARLPIHVSTDPPAVRAGERTFAGEELGAAFIYPNPDAPSRYVVVLAGADIAGTMRLASLPDMLPDFVVTDRAVLPARGQLILGAGASLVAGGMFDEDWKLPAQLDDPRRARPSPAPATNLP